MHEKHERTRCAAVGPVALAGALLLFSGAIARTMGSEGLDKWTRVILPASLPFLVTGMKQGWAFAWRSLMAAEIYVTILTGFGLGHLLHYGRELSAMDQVIGVMLVTVVIGLATDKSLFAPWERFMHRRWGTGTVQ
jgi:NitT/TauT family transport system permease protein